MYLLLQHLVVLVIYKVLQGAVIKGTFDNVYDQQKGKKILETAGKALILFIVAYAILTFINPDLTGWTFIQTLAKDTIGNNSSNNSGGRNGDKCEIDTKYNSSSLTDKIKQDEEDSKYKKYVYMDTADTPLPTIGWGFNLAQSGASDIMREAGIEDATIQALESDACKKVSVNDTNYSKSAPDSNCQTSISEPQANALLEKEMKAHEKAIFAFVGGETNYKALPKKYQDLIATLAYSGDALITPGTTKYFKILNKDINASTIDPKAVANDITDSTWCTTVKQRCARVVGSILESCPTQTNSDSIASKSNSSNSDLLKKYGVIAACPTGTTDLGTVKTNYIGNPTIRLCEINNIPGVGRGINNETKDHAVLNAVVAADFVKLAEDAKNANPSVALKSNSSFRLDDSGSNCTGGGDGVKCAKNGSSMHQLGLAIDFTIKCNNVNTCGSPYVIEKASCSNRAHSGDSNDTVYNWLNKNSLNDNINQYAGEAWHFDEGQANSSRCTTS